MEVVYHELAILFLVYLFLDVALTVTYLKDDRLLIQVCWEIYSMKGYKYNGHNMYL